jgi:hypothetical protein
MQGDVLLAQHGCCRPVSPRSSRLPRSPQGPHEVVVPKCDVHYVRRNVRQDACELANLVQFGESGVCIGPARWLFRQRLEVRLVAFQFCRKLKSD